MQVSIYISEKNFGVMDKYKPKDKKSVSSWITEIITTFATNLETDIPKK
jgi:hypothetical protein